MPENIHEPIHSSLHRLRSTFRGEVITPDDAPYDRARTIFYTGYSARPAVVVRPIDTRDVVRAVNFTRETGAALAVRSGGHSLAGHGVAEGGIVLDLSSMKAIDFDAAGRTAWAQGGLTAGEYTAAMGVHGLATGFGDAPSVGIGGITLGGGLGFLHRKTGLTIDSLLAAEIVTASGETLYVDAGSHPDLFWAIRGGGGNFGVVTRFRFRLHGIDQATGGILMAPATSERIVRFVSALQEAPDELSGVVNVMLAPPMPFIPAEHHGKEIIFAALMHVGPPEEGARVLAPFRDPGSVVTDMIAPLRYANVYEGGDPPHPARMAAHSFFTDTVDLAAGEAILEQLHRSTAPMRVAQFRALGGAVARVAPDETAFAHRNRGMMALAAAAFENAAEATEHGEWASALAASLRQGERGAYVGFLGDEGEARVREAYPGATWDRLRRVKDRYDPENLFRLNQNVPPSGVVSESNA